MSVPHPIPYQGSKRNLARTIAAYFPSDSLRLIEPFAGSAAVSLYAAQHRQFQNYIINDINEPLIALWDAIIHRPEQLARFYAFLWTAQEGRQRQFYDLVRQRFNRTHRPYYLLYLLARCVKASVRYNANGEFNQSPDNRRKGRRPEAMKQDIMRASKLLKGNTQLLSRDYRDVLSLAVPNDLVYLDPPYQGVCANRDTRYFRGVEHESLVEALAELVQKDISFILSYDGRTGTKNYGKSLPEHLGLRYLEIEAGRSSQATLLGRRDQTYESLYLSPALVRRLNLVELSPMQLPLFVV